MEAIRIDNPEMYWYAVKQGFEPLLDKRFAMDISTRVAVQRKLFGEVNTPDGNERFYRWVWEHKQHVCEETMRPLHEYSAVYISHILTRGAHPELAHDPRNCNILCGQMHNKWEYGKRSEMRIFERNKRVIEQLRKEYHE